MSRTIASYHHGPMATTTMCLDGDGTPQWLQLQIGFHHCHFEDEGTLLEQLQEDVQQQQQIQE